MIDWLIDNGFLLAIGLFAVVGAWVARNYWIQLKKRNLRPENFKQVAEKQGFTFLGEDAEFLDLIKQRLKDSTLVNLAESSGRLQKILSSETSISLSCANVSKLATDFADCFLFDFSRTRHSTDQDGLPQSSTIHQTVLFCDVKSNDVKLPTLLIRPKKLSNKIMSALGINTVQLDDGSKIASKYHVAGHDSAAITSFLNGANGELDSAISTRSDFCVESWGNNLLVSLAPDTGKSFGISNAFSDGRIGIDHVTDLETFLKQALQVAKAAEQTMH